MLSWVQLLEVNLDVARKFGEIDAQLLDQGATVGDIDVFNAAVAQVHNLTMVTHNTKDYAVIPGLPLDDWLTP